jgi:hypothetical protein
MERTSQNSRTRRNPPPTVVRAALDPNEVTLYALRHSSIARDLLANVPVRIVATKHDTSILMIERNYSKYISDHADNLSRRAMLDPGSRSDGNVLY